MNTHLLYSQSVSLAILGLEATLGSDLPARLMAMILNWYSCPFTSFCSVTVVAAVSRHSQICQSPPCSHTIVHNDTTIQSKNEIESQPKVTCNKIKIKIRDEIAFRKNEDILIK